MASLATDLNLTLASPWPSTPDQSFWHVGKLSHNSGEEGQHSSPLKPEEKVYMLGWSFSGSEKQFCTSINSRRVYGDL